VIGQVEDVVSADEIDKNSQADDIEGATQEEELFHQEGRKPGHEIP
jgi:hypothetical protein